MPLEIDNLRAFQSQLFDQGGLLSRGLLTRLLEFGVQICAVFYDTHPLIVFLSLADRHRVLGRRGGAVVASWEKQRCLIES